MALRTVLRRPRTWLIAVPVLALLVGVVAPYVYIHFVMADPPPRLALDVAAASTDTTETRDGTWTVTDGSRAGYRVDEVLFGQDAEAVGRTSAVTGKLVIDGTTVESADFTVDLTTVESDESRRDNQFRGRIMDTATYPTATFRLTEPISLDSLELVTTEVTGELGLHGVTKLVTFELSAQSNGDNIEVTGTIPITFEDYGIPDASFGPATVQDHGEIEFLLVHEAAAATP